MNRIIGWIVLLLALTIDSPSFGVSNPVQDSFRFELHNANIFPWIEGRAAGPVTDRQGSMAKRLEELVGKAKWQVDAAIYGVSKQAWFFRALDHLVARKIKVRMVVDQSGGAMDEWIPANFMYKDTAELHRHLMKGAILPDIGPTNRPRSGSIMHNKFVVTDRTKLWLGSTNLSHTGLGAEYNANSSIIIDSPELARIFSQEFVQMHTGRSFSRAKQPTAPRHSLRYRDGTDVSVFFSPQDNTLENAVIPFIEAARRSLDIGMFFLTDESVARALIDAARRGVRVRLIYDALAAAHPSSKDELLRAGGVDVKIENWGGKMHMKSALADGRNLLMGSMNWSKAGNLSNDESTLVIKNNKAVGRQFAAYFKRLWNSLPGASTTTTESLVAPPQDPRAEGTQSINSCSDGIDNDHDGYLDKADFGCR